MRRSDVGAEHAPAGRPNRAKRKSGSRNRRPTPIGERAGDTTKSLKFLGWIMKSKKEEQAAPPALTKDQELLSEIRDLLRARG